MEQFELIKHLSLILLCIAIIVIMSFKIPVLFMQNPICVI